MNVESEIIMSEAWKKTINCLDTKEWTLEDHVNLGVMFRIGFLQGMECAQKQKEQP